MQAWFQFLVILEFIATGSFRWHKTSQLYPDFPELLYITVSRGSLFL